LPVCKFYYFLENPIIGCRKPFPIWKRKENIAPKKSKRERKTAGIGE
jgi:hypothetical protein